MVGVYIVILVFVGCIVCQNFEFCEILKGNPIVDWEKSCAIIWKYVDISQQVHILSSVQLV